MGYFAYRDDGEWELKFEDEGVVLFEVAAKLEGLALSGAWDVKYWGELQTKYRSVASMFLEVGFDFHDNTVMGFDGKWNRWCVVPLWATTKWAGESQITFRGEDGDFWGYKAKDGGLYEMSAELMWTTYPKPMEVPGYF